MKRCPGGPGINVDSERLEAECQGCGTVFSTAMDKPVFPAHWLDDDGRVLFYPEDWI